MTYAVIGGVKELSESYRNVIKDMVRSRGGSTFRDSIVMSRSNAKDFLGNPMVKGLGLYEVNTKSNYDI